MSQKSQQMDGQKGKQMHLDMLKGWMKVVAWILKMNGYTKLCWSKISRGMNMLDGCLHRYSEDEVYYVPNQHQLDVEVFTKEILEVEHVPPMLEHVSPVPKYCTRNKG